MRTEAEKRLLRENEFPHLPDGWRIERFRFLFRESKERNGRAPVGDMLSVSEYWGVTPRIYDHQEQRRTDEELENYRVVRPGQLAVNTMWLNHLGLGVSDHLGHVSPAYAVYDIAERLDRRFVHHLLRSQLYLKVYLRYLYGIRPNSFQIKADDWGSIPVVVPDLDTQKAIADFLDKETARIDQLIEKKQRLVELLGEKLAAEKVALVTRGLDPNATMSAHPVGWLHEAPAHWSVVRMASIFDEVDERGEDGLPVLSVSINWGISDRELGDEDRHRIVNQIADRTAYKRVRPGDLAYNMMRAWQGAFGVSSLDGLVSPAYVVARPRQHIHSPYFEPLLRTPMCIEEFRRASKGIADFRQRLYWEHFRQVKVVLPPIEEQEAIARRVAAQTQAISSVVAPVEASIDRLKEYRSALITAAVTGQIDVTRWGRTGEGDKRLNQIQQEMAG